KEKKVQPESVMERMERQRSEIEDNILGKISKDALDTMELEELKSLAEKIHSIEENRTYDTEEGTELFTCLNCKTVFALFPDDPRKCTNCSDKVSLVKAEEVLKHCDMLYG
ncbi:MAG: hypothetical protein U9N45_02975, partial [Gemmatimonadota bacterium]|nr:hypothetical protein [Gemmatimonadota bacterium]